ncbi:TnsA-like heteromeric transposase endonuclease subunit [Streptomyces sp. NPDC005533]|uniref:TnsA-like heteromeric transposase endonuclease subunit n=1 Tax=Streptomyces sp. NPDC005533 TaxID=3364723 RepID=UPI0036B84827
MAVEELADAYADPDLGAFNLGFLEDGVQAIIGRVLGRPVRAGGTGAAVPKGGESFAGWYFCTTTDEHIGYESWLERDRLILLDADPQVAGVASQPFWLHWRRSTAPSSCPGLLRRLADGRGRVVDVRAADRVDDAAAEAFAATGRACRAAGWEFARVGVPDPVLMANMRWLSRYRRRRCLRPESAAVLMDVFGEPGPLRAGAIRVGDPLGVLPVLFHLLWSGALATEVSARLLGVLHATTRGL